MAPFGLAVDEEEGVLLLLLLPLEGVVEVEVVFEPDPENEQCKKGENRNKQARARYIPHSACCSARADAWSAAVQFALRHAAAALWKAVLVHTQVMSVLEKEERIREGGPVAVDEG